MKRILTGLLLSVSAPLAEEAPVSFSRQIAPILQAKCSACHGEEKAKGGYRTHTFAATVAARDDESPSVVAGKPEESELFKRLVTGDPDDRMPQEDEPLPPEQVELFKRWIAEGALLDAGDPNATLSALAPAFPHPAPPEVYPRPLPVLALAFDPGGEWLAVNGYHEITFWSPEGQLVRRVTNAPPRVRSIAMHPNGSHFAIAGGKAGWGGEVSLYNLSASQFETNLLRTSDEMLAVAFSSDGKHLAAAGSDNTIHVFDWEARKEITTISQHADWVTALAFSADGQHLASASRDRTARVYDTVEGNLETTYVAHTAALFAVAALSPERIASGGRDRAIHLWKISDGKKQNEIGTGPGVHQLLCSDGQLFSASQDGVVRQHNAEDRKLTRHYEGHKDAVFAIALDGSGKRLASGSYDGELRIWRVETGELLHAFFAAPGFTGISQ